MALVSYVTSLRISFYSFVFSFSNSLGQLLNNLANFFQCWRPTGGTAYHGEEFLHRTRSCLKKLGYRQTERLIPMPVTTQPPWASQRAYDFLIDHVFIEKVLSSQE